MRLLLRVVNFGSHFLPMAKRFKKATSKNNYLAGKRQRRRVPKDNHAKCQGPFYNTWVHIEMSRRSLRPTLLSTRRFGSHVDRSGSFFFSSPRSLTFFIHAVGPHCAVGGVVHPSSQNRPAIRFLCNPYGVIYLNIYGVLSQVPNYANLNYSYSKLPYDLFFLSPCGYLLAWV